VRAHNSDGTLKDNSVGSTQIQNNAITANTIAPNSITNTAIATGAVTAASIATGTITETLLAGAVQTKLNQPDPTWTTITGKPAVIAAGVDAEAARLAIGAADGSGTKSGDAWWNEVFMAPVADDTPTVTVSTATTIGGGTAILPTTDYYGDSHFRYDGCISVTTPGAGLVSAIQPSGGATFPIVPEFVTSPACDRVDVLFKTNSGGTAMGVRVIINGKWLTLPLQWFVTPTNTVQYIHLVFPTAKARSIRVEATSTSSFGGVVVPSGATVTRPAREIQKRMVVIGDSYAKGANSNTTSDPATNGTAVFETFVHYVAQLLGCDSIINLAVGGTGWMDDNAGADSTFGGRIADTLSAAPHIVLAVGTRNDSAYSATQIYTAAASALTQLADVPVVEVCGPEDDGVGTTGTSAADANDAIMGAARTAGRRFNDMIGVITALDKNSADGVHPSVLGAQKLAKAFYASLERSTIDESVSSAVGGRASTDLTLAASPAGAATVGATITLTATQGTVRAGKVSFYANNTLISTNTLSSGTAVATTSSLAAGTYTFTARFLPTNPILVKSSSSNAVTGYSVSANLGFTDTFTRADGAVGSTENSKVYTTSGTGAWVVSSNKLANPTLSGTTFCVADAGTPNGTLQVTIGGTGGVGLGANMIMRYIDNANSLSLARSSNEVVLNKRIANTTTQVAISSGSAVWVAGDVITVVMSGDTFTAKKNGVDITGLTGITCSDLNTATRHGIGTSSSGAGATFDNLSFVA
jgi:hypothetical protein